MQEQEVARWIAKDYLSDSDKNFKTITAGNTKFFIAPAEELADYVVNVINPLHEPHSLHYSFGSFYLVTGEVSGHIPFEDFSRLCTVTKQEVGKLGEVFKQLVLKNNHQTVRVLKMLLASGFVFDTVHVAIEKLFGFDYQSKYVTLKRSFNGGTLIAIIKASGEIELTPNLYGLRKDIFLGTPAEISTMLGHNWYCEDVQFEQMQRHSDNLRYVVSKFDDYNMLNDWSQLDKNAEIRNDPQYLEEFTRDTRLVHGNHFAAGYVVVAVSTLSNKEANPKYLFRKVVMRRKVSEGIYVFALHQETFVCRDEESPSV